MSKNKKKRNYNSPEMEIIHLDNEISLVLQTTPPKGPGENNIQQENMQESPVE